ncbi:Transposon Tf2-9 polyprotein [Labeo rohita]|uniref:Transposon Tf2-9 polyprotein n=1 Tax=Labeo rohita TaxID=84645 RepID=A0ABQ8MMB7_LABRO|nr:Transposon Tf2-9 polyprotein [Labeo rohita]
MSAVCDRQNSTPSGKLLSTGHPSMPMVKPRSGCHHRLTLPTSNGNTCILVIADRFSCKLIPRKGLPTAIETAKALFNQAFGNFGILKDIVSDCSPQSILLVWKAFFSLLGVTISLTSWYHPQSSEQMERKVQEIIRFLRTFCQSHQDS